MPEQKQSIFMPIEPGLEGPFSQYLHPAPQQPKPQPHTAPMASGGLAYIAQSFIDGQTQARQQQFVMEEKKQANRLRQIEAAWAPILNDPNALPELKQQAQRAITMASISAFDVDGDKKKGGKKSKDKQPPSGPNVPGGEAAGVFKEIMGTVVSHVKSGYERATGGPFPKFSEIDPAKSQAEVMSFYQPSEDGKGLRLKPEYTVEGKVSTLMGQLGQKANELAGQAVPRERAESELKPLIAQIGKYDPSMAAAAEAKLGMFYPEYSVQHLMQVSAKRQRDASGRPIADAAAPATAPPPTVHDAMQSGTPATREELNKMLPSESQYSASITPWATSPRAPGLPPATATPPTVQGQVDELGWNSALFDNVMQQALIKPLPKNVFGDEHPVIVTDEKTGERRRTVARSTNLTGVGLPPAWIESGTGRPLLGMKVELTGASAPVPRVMASSTGTAYVYDANAPVGKQFTEHPEVKIGVNQEAKAAADAAYRKFQQEIQSKRLAVSQQQQATRAAGQAIKAASVGRKEYNDLKKQAVAVYNREVQSAEAAMLRSKAAVQVDTSGTKKPEEKQAAIAALDAMLKDQLARYKATYESELASIESMRSGDEDETPATRAKKGVAPPAPNYKSPKAVNSLIID